ncbi:hypothetical protein B0H16DRAFT_1323322 [Mycena metata]|uniref:Tc1-like transposase DDE domain-containing protein n=1 Tax=Mycena metata TaxID=1033252 RepID=A0AAD7N3A6_9AGAR|nr:hypothetical protein B0H16DRAFT_1323322 [Mycena metata]
MGNHRISSDLKERALVLWESGWEIKDICYAFHVSPTSLYRWRDMFDEFGTTTKPPSPLRGRERIISLAALNAAKEIFFHDPSVMLDELMWYLAIHHDIAISKSALQATLVRAGLTRKMLQKIACKRDESSKDTRDTACHYGRSPIGEPAIYSHQFIRDERYTLTAAMSTQGYITTHIVEGSMDTYDFFDFIVEDVLPQMKPFPDVQSVLVLDNCRIHHTDLLQEVLNENGVRR